MTRCDNMCAKQKEMYDLILIKWNIQKYERGGIMKEKRKEIIIVIVMVAVICIGINCFMRQYELSLGWMGNIIISLGSGMCVIAPVYIGWKRYRLENVPKLCLKVINVSDIKRSRRRETEYQISIGEGNYYIYVMIQIKNIGQGSIENCLINGWTLDTDCINAKEEVMIMIASNKRDAFNKEYSLQIEVEDALGRKYSAVKLLNIDAKKKQANISTKKKQRRKIYGRHEKVKRRRNKTWAERWRK